ncbi:MAG: hypothetical protein KJO76_09190, partial [Gammaproteobacteria bacterium]|nr:hypothetical protein [Gammaproteobacteria bacterium]
EKIFRRSPGAASTVFGGRGAHRSEDGGRHSISPLRSGFFRKSSFVDNLQSGDETEVHRQSALQTTTRC